MPKENKDNIEVEAKVYLTFGPAVNKEQAIQYMEVMLNHLFNEMANNGGEILETETDDHSFSFTCDEAPAFKVTKF